jgi:hypothetical protein
MSFHPKGLSLTIKTAVPTLVRTTTVNKTRGVSLRILRSRRVVKKTKAVSKTNIRGDNIIKMPAARIGALSGVPSGFVYGIPNQLSSSPMIRATTKKAPAARGYKECSFRALDHEA